MSIAPGEESAVDDFAVLLFRALGRRSRVFRARKDIPFVVCGENKHETDVCILFDDTEILLLVHEDRQYLVENSDPQTIRPSASPHEREHRRHSRVTGLQISRWEKSF
jgi:hypothetical protein